MSSHILKLSSLIVGATKLVIYTSCIVLGKALEPIDWTFSPIIISVILLNLKASSPIIFTELGIITFPVIELSEKARELITSTLFPKVNDSNFVVTKTSEPIVITEWG